MLKIIFIIIYFIIGIIIGIHLSVDTYTKRIMWLSGMIVTLFWLPILIVSASIYFYTVVKNGHKRNKMQQL